MLVCMKTTVELPDGLLREAKRVAGRERTTVRALIEQGLRAALSARTRRAFALRKASFAGDGLAAGQTLDDWDSLRDRIYSGRGA